MTNISRSIRYMESAKCINDILARDERLINDEFNVLNSFHNKPVIQWFEHLNIYYDVSPIIQTAVLIQQSQYNQR